MKDKAKPTDNLLEGSPWRLVTLAYPSTSVDQYRKSAVNSASPLQLVVMLYDGALRFMEGAKHAMAQEDLYRQNELCQKAQNIMVELMSCLDTTAGGEIAQSLLSLYTYSYDQLVEANINDDPEPIDRAIKVMSDLRESWAQLESMTKTPVEQSDVAA